MDLKTLMEDVHIGHIAEYQIQIQQTKEAIALLREAHGESMVVKTLLESLDELEWSKSQSFKALCGVDDLIKDAQSASVLLQTVRKGYYREDRR